MKNILKLTSIVLGLFLVGCDAIDDSRFQANRTSGWVEFDGSEYYFLNRERSETIPIQYNVPINRENTVITYTAEFLAGTNPGVEEGTFETIVPADTRDAGIDYDFPLAENGNYTVRFTMTNVSNPDVIIGLEGNNPFVIDVTVVRDFDGIALTPDCGPENNEFVLNVNPTEEDGQYLLSSAWGTNYVAALTGNPAFEGLFIYESVLTLTDELDGSGNNVISIVGVDDALFPGTDLGVDEDGDPRTPCESQTFNPLTGEMNYTLSQNLFNGDFLVGVTLTPASAD